jgi:hypothetical protein
MTIQPIHEHHDEQIIYSHFCGPRKGIMNVVYDVPMEPIRFRERHDRKHSLVAA